MEIAFCRHAEEKLDLLKERGFPISKDQVVDCLQEPDKIEPGWKGRKIAQKGFDEMHVLRVVFDETEIGTRVITVYPGRRKRYED